MRFDTNTHVHYRDRDRVYRRRWWTLAVLSVSLLIVIIDDTVINVALPTLQRELHASAAGLQWIVDAYILAFASLLLTMGALGDRYGRKRFLQLGLVVFAAASVFSAYASTTGALIVGRAVMGVGGALIMPSTLSVLVDVFPREERVRAIGIWTGIASLGIPLGPIVAGWLLERFWWGSVFLLNLPIAIISLVAGAVLVPESRNLAPRRLDPVGMASSAAALTALVYGIIEAPSKGWTSPAVIGAFVTAAVIGAAFVAHEARTTEPMLDLALFRQPRLAWGTVAISLASLALTGLAFELTQYLQVAKGYTPLQAGLRFVPIALGFGIAGPASQRLVARLGVARTVAGGLGVVAALFALLSQIDAATSYWLLGPVLFGVGIGVGAAFVPATDAVMATVPEGNASLGSAINDTSRQVGAALGIGIMGSLANAAYASRIGPAATRLGSGVAAAARQSVNAAVQIADRIGGPAGSALRRAAITAFSDGFGIAVLVIGVVLALGAVVIGRRLPSEDTSPDQPEAPLAVSADGDRDHRIWDFQAAGSLRGSVGVYDDERRASWNSPMASSPRRVSHRQVTDMNGPPSQPLLSTVCQRDCN
jgi:EmrB/QacA subfamily drug resistance transporter